MKPLRFLALSFLLCSCATSRSAEVITATLSITNAAIEDETLTVNASVRTFKDTVVSPATQIGTTNTAARTATNIFNQFALNRVTGVNSPTMANETNIVFRSAPAFSLTVTVSGDFGEVTYETNSSVTAIALRLPYSVETAAVRTQQLSNLATMLSGPEATVSISQSGPAAAQLLGTTNAQTISGAKDFESEDGVWRGAVTDSPSISGTALVIADGLYSNPVLTDPISTNGVNYGDAFSSPGDGVDSEQFGAGATATGEASFAAGKDATAAGLYSTAVGQGSSASGESSVALGSVSAAGDDKTIAIGFGSIANGTNSIAIGTDAVVSENNSVALGQGSTAEHENSVALGYFAATTASNQVMLGSSTVSVRVNSILQVGGSISNATLSGTANFPAGSDIAFGRALVSSLANGNNAAVPVSTNVFVEVSGPSGAFTINGLANGRDGKLVVIVNQTGQDMTVAHQSGTDPTAGNRIVSMTGADRTTTGNGTATLIYSAAASRWILIAFDP